MDLAFLLAAFVLGFAAQWIRLPPLVGYLAAGFVLHEFGYTAGEGIELVSGLGVLLLLFGIGLKLDLRTLSRAEVWVGGSLHIAVSTAFIAVLVLAGGAVGFPVLSDLSIQESLLIGFALAFSSTVFAVKALEDRNESASLAGRIAIGILIVQDLFAVAFLAASAGKAPSPWAIPVVLAVVLARPLYGWLLDRAGHGELLILFGFFLAVGVGAGLFEMVGLKADLGALLVGVTLARHPRARELADRLLSFKDILLVGFFLSVGLGGIPSGGGLVVAVLALLLLPVKTAGFMALLPRFRLRVRTAWHSSITLATFSEFGLIVVAAGIAEGYIDGEWAAIIAVIVALSFGIASPFNVSRYGLFRRWSSTFERLERDSIKPDDALIDPGPARVLVFGMGRIGAGAYDEIVLREGEVVVGVDRAMDSSSDHDAVGRKVIHGDALDIEFWERLRFRPGIDLVVAAMGDHLANVEAVRRVKTYLPDARIAATARYEDEVRELEEAGVDVARNLFSEAGQGLADDACDLIAAQIGGGAAESEPEGQP
ncbi:MAG: cation:proton antiporter family protein [Acidimicrobiia bacterium]